MMFEERNSTVETIGGKVTLGSIFHKEKEVEKTVSESYYAKVSIIGSECKYLAIREKPELPGKKIGEIHLLNKFIEVNPISSVFHWDLDVDPAKNIVHKHDVFFYKLIGRSGWIHDFNVDNPDSRTLTIVGAKVNLFSTI